MKPRPGDDVGSPGARQARRQKARRRHFWLMLGAVAVLLGLTVGFGAIIRNGSDDSSKGAPAADRAGATGTPAVLLFGHRGAGGGIDLLVLVGSGRGSASVLLFPVATQVEVPSLGPQALADLPDEAGLLQTTIENLVGVKVAQTVMVDDAGLNAALAAAAPMNVDLNREVEFADLAAGIVPAGPTRRSAGEAAQLLVAPQAGSELDRLVTVQDVLEAWMRRLRNPADRAGDGASATRVGGVGRGGEGGGPAHGHASGRLGDHRWRRALRAPHR